MNLPQLLRLSKKLAAESGRLAKEQIWKEATSRSDPDSLLACMKLVSGRPLGAVGDKLNTDKTVLKGVFEKYRQALSEEPRLPRKPSIHMDLSTVISLIGEISRIRATGSEDRKAHHLLDFLDAWNLDVEESELLVKLLLVRSN